MTTGDAARSESLERATAFLDAGGTLARLAFIAHYAGDDMQRELYAREVEDMVQRFDALPAQDREFILWAAFSREQRRRR